MRIRVTDVLDLLAAGLNFDQILDEMPDLEREDITAVINYAKQHPQLVPTTWNPSEARESDRIAPKNPQGGRVAD